MEEYTQVVEGMDRPIHDIYRLQVLEESERKELNEGYDPLAPLPPELRSGAEPIPEPEPVAPGYDSPMQQLQGLKDAIVSGVSDVVDRSDDDGTVTVTGDRYVTRRPMYPLCPDIPCGPDDVDRLEFYVLYEQTATFDPERQQVIVSDELSDYSAETWESLLDDVNDEFCPDSY